MIQKAFKQITHTYSLLAFSESSAVGLIIALLTLTIPNTGICGVVAIAFTMLLNILLKVPHEHHRITLFNGLMVGLCCGMVYVISPFLMLIIIVGCVMSIMLSMNLNSILTEKTLIPIFNTPFAISIAILFLAVQSYGTLEHTQYRAFPSISMPLVFECFFRSFGMVILMPHVIFGIAVFALVALTSQYLAFVAIVSYTIGFYTFNTLNGIEYSDFMARNGFNLFLPALVLAMFTVPSFSSFALCILSAVVSSVVIVAMHNFFSTVHMPITTLPFLFTTITILFALKKRTNNVSPVLNIFPVLPSESFEKARFSNGRMNVMLPHLHLPYFGTWSVYQGFNGKYTHQKDWRYATDFHIILDDKPYSGDGSKLEDYYAYGKPVTSPVYGTVCAVQNSVEDNQVGNVNQAENWGNYVLIYAGVNCYIMVSHLQYSSVKVCIGEYITPSIVIGLCGNSGRSPRPHIHIHVQKTSQIGSETMPFRFLNVIKNNNQFCLSSIPKEGETFKNAHASEIQQSLKMQVGVAKTYAGFGVSTHIITDVDFYGNLSVVTLGGAKAAFIQNQNCLSFYERNSVKDNILDSIILACGFTPFSGEIWQDSPPISFFPIGRFRKVFYGQFVMFVKTESNFRRVFDYSTSTWVQEGKHQISIFNLFKTSIKTRCIIGLNGIEEIAVTRGVKDGKVAEIITLQEIKISAK